MHDLLYYILYLLVCPFIHLTYVRIYLADHYPLALSLMDPD